MTLHAVTLSDSELAIVTAALGYAPTAKPKPARRVAAPKAYRPKPPTLPKGKWGDVERRWREACECPEMWHAQLLIPAGVGTGRLDPDDVLKAWGISLPERA